MSKEEQKRYFRGSLGAGVKPGLERIRALGRLAGEPQRKLKFIHVAGTNGKGSTAVMLMHILAAAGYRAGLFTSPPIRTIREQIRVDGRIISEPEFAQLADFLLPLAKSMDDRPTAFEFMTLAALEYFYRNRCDIVVLEAGMGGRLDSTNFIETAEAAVITSIGLDHKRELGDTLEAIAEEKAGIVKPGIDVVLYPQDIRARRAVEEACRRMQARLHMADFGRIAQRGAGPGGQTFDLPGLPGLCLPLLGDHQQKKRLRCRSNHPDAAGKRVEGRRPAYIRGPETCQVAGPIRDAAAGPRGDSGRRA